MSRFTRFSWGKIWFVDIGPCKRFDIFQLCSCFNFPNSTQVACVHIELTISPRPIFLYFGECLVTESREHNQCDKNCKKVNFFQKLVVTFNYVQSNANVVVNLIDLQSSWRNVEQIIRPESIYKQGAKASSCDANVGKEA